MKSSKLLGTALLRASVLRSGHSPTFHQFSSITGSQDLRPASFSLAQAHFKRFNSSVAPQLSQDEEHQQQQQPQSNLSQYWGVAPKKTFREDGTPWPWNSFRPSDAYASNLNVDLKKHHTPDTVVDKVALRTVKFLRKLSDLFFQKRHGCHAVLLETVAAVPGMAGGMLLHLKSLRKFEQSGGWIKALLEEAENERMHLMTFMEVYQPKWYERALVLAVQGVFFNGYFLLYILYPRLAHRVVGYLEEEAVISYTDFLEALDKGEMPNGPAPAIAIDYWRLPKEATIRDVVAAVRADETRHRDVNHYAADVHFNGKELREAPVPH